MPRYPRFTTFAPGEHQQRLREIAPQAALVLSAQENTSPTGLLKAHTFSVQFPDGQSGTCQYERASPGWHLFAFRYVDGTQMPRQFSTERLANDLASIEAKGKELTRGCYLAAVIHERRHYFERASEPSDGSRKRRPERYRMKAAKAKELAGCYALCHYSEIALIALGPVYTTLEAANCAWQEKADTRIVVGCCNRLDRCWELMRFNPLYAEFDPRPAFVEKEEPRS